MDKLYYFRHQPIRILYLPPVTYKTAQLPVQIEGNMDLIDQRLPLVLFQSFVERMQFLFFRIYFLQHPKKDQLKFTEQHLLQIG